MRPRTELAIGLAAFGAVILLGYAAGREGRGNLAGDLRTSSTATGPNGTRALAEVIERSGGRVSRWSDRLARLPKDSVQGGTLAILQPPMALGDGDATPVLAVTRDRANLLLAGFSTMSVIRCLGYAFDWTVLDSLSVRAPSGALRGDLATSFVRDTVSRKPRRRVGEEGAACPVVPIARVDTLLAAGNGQPVMLRLHRQDSPYVILLVSDIGLISNKGLQLPEVPEVAIRAILGASPHVVFDEFVHGAQRGSMRDAALQWSLASPMGWAAWQLAVVGFLAFLAGALRFGPVRKAISRQRRSPLEHVKALATALAASNGHDVAIGALARGLQRRLATAGGESARRTPRVGRRDWAAWVTKLAARIPDPAARERTARLTRFAKPGQPDNAVRAMANDVEDVWDALHR